MEHKVYFVGAGPGEPSLITVRGREILRTADVVIYDYLIDERLLDDARHEAELISCGLLGKSRHCGSFAGHQEKINNLIIKKALEGKKVIRLKNGDPFIFGRASEEIRALVKNRIPYEIVPGVTAANAASSFSGIPLTERNCASSCVFVTGHENQAKKNSSVDWGYLSGLETVVLYMGVETLPQISRKLIKAGKAADTPVAVIQGASLLTQKLVRGNLKDIAYKAGKEHLKPPAIIIIGEVVRRAKEFDWFTKVRRVLFTGISERRFFERKFIFQLPLIKILPLNDYREFDHSLKDIASYDWLVFSSRYGVMYFFERLNRMGLDSRNLSKTKVAAIGDSTGNKLLEFGVIADLIPKDESSKGLIEAFKKIDLTHKKIFMPRSDLSDKGLVNGLEAHGASVTAKVAYKNIMPENLPDIDFGLFDEIRFSSPSGVRNFIKRYGPVPKKVKISCIGDVTKREARRWHPKHGF